MNKSTKDRFDAILKQQQDAGFLKDNFMPKVDKSAKYDAPKQLKHKIEMRHENMFVITNNEHSKATNNGYKRGVTGAFFCHWAARIECPWRQKCEQVITALVEGNNKSERVSAWVITDMVQADVFRRELPFRLHRVLFRVWWVRKKNQLWTILITGHTLISISIYSIPVRTRHS